jgi:hypothetical protein
VTLVVELTDDEEIPSDAEFLYVSATGGELESYVPSRRLTETDGADPPLTCEVPLKAAPHRDEYTVYLDGVEERQTLDARTVSRGCDRPGELNERPEWVGKMPSRRAVLTAAGTAAVAALAGCGGLTGEASSDDGNVRTCGTSAEARDESSDLIQSADVQPGETAVLRVVLNDDSEAFEVFDSLTVSTTSGDAYLLPREDAANPDDPRRLYEQALGAFPQNGRAEITANAEDGETLDSLTVEFTCHRTTPAQGN